MFKFSSPIAAFCLLLLAIFELQSSVQSAGGNTAGGYAWISNGNSNRGQQQQQLQPYGQRSLQTGQRAYQIPSYTNDLYQSPSTYRQQVRRQPRNQYKTRRQNRYAANKRVLSQQQQYYDNQNQDDYNQQNYYNNGNKQQNPQQQRRQTAVGIGLATIGNNPRTGSYSQPQSQSSQQAQRSAIGIGVGSINSKAVDLSSFLPRGQQQSDYQNQNLY